MSCVCIHSESHECGVRIEQEGRVLLSKGRGGSRDSNIDARWIASASLNLRRENVPMPLLNKGLCVRFLCCYDRQIHHGTSRLHM